MTAPVMDSLPLLAGSPNGIQQLRRLILELAFRGKLTQLTGDSISVVESTRNFVPGESTPVAEGGRPAYTEGAEAGGPFALPRGWRWVHFGSIAQHNSGKTLDKGRNTGQPRDYITTSNLYWGRFELSNVRQMLIREDELERCLARKGDLLICEGGEAGRAAVWEFDSEICFQNHIHRARFSDCVNPYFAFRFFERMNATGEINAFRKGVGISNMSSKSLASIPLPLPPIADQHRIVAKINELMALCDRLEAEQADAEAAHAKLVEALIASLTQARDAADFRASWQQLTEHFHTLFTTDESVGALKAAVVQLGVMGKLVPQRADEGTAASDLIRVANSPVMRAVRTRKAQETSDVEAPPFRIPDTWVWTRIGQIATSTDYGLSEKTTHGVHGAPVLKMGDIQRGKVLLETSARVAQNVEGLPDLYLEPGDLLYNRTNSAELVGKTGLFMGPGGEYTFASYLIRVRFDAEFVSSRYINYVMNSPLFRETQINPHLKQQCGQANVNGTVMKNMLVSLPPLAEQHRIVAKVDELLGLCDQLTQDLATARQSHEHLAFSLVELAVG